MLNYLEDTIKLLHRIEDYLDSKLVTDIFRPKNHFFLELNTLRIGLDFVPDALRMIDEEGNIDKEEINYLFDVLNSMFRSS
jgi:uncharacterized protein (DUF2164 family)